MRVMNIAGNRTNMVKIAALMKAYGKKKLIKPSLVHTGWQHAKRENKLLLGQLGIAEPDVDLGVGSGSHATQTANIMTAFENVLLGYLPDVVVVVGDANCTVACGLVAAKLGIPVAHVDAGVRSFDRNAPEEINRILTDSLCDVLFCSEQKAVDNLLRQGMAEENVILVGNVAVDTLFGNIKKITASGILEELGVCTFASFQAA